MNKQFLFIRFDETGYEFKESDNLDDFAYFDHYFGSPDDPEWIKEKKRIKEEMWSSWVFNGNDTYYEILRHPCWDKFYIPEIIKLDNSEQKEIKSLEIDHASWYLDEVLDYIYSSDWFWAYIYTFDGEKLEYVYTVDDDGNVYNDDERWKMIKNSFSSEGEFNEFMKDIEMIKEDINDPTSKN